MQCQPVSRFMGSVACSAVGVRTTCWVIGRGSARALGAQCRRPQAGFGEGGLTEGHVLEGEGAPSI